MERFENAALLLYNAFNEGTLDQNDCSACAVGNLLGHSQWRGGVNAIYHKRGLVENLNRKEIRFILDSENTSDYTIYELSKIEKIFLDSFVGLLVEEEMNKDNQYNALMNVLEYLAELDGITIPEVTIESFKSVLTTA